MTRFLRPSWWPYGSLAGPLLLGVAGALMVLMGLLGGLDAQGDPDWPFAAIGAAVVLVVTAVVGGTHQTPDQTHR